MSGQSSNLTLLEQLGERLEAPVKEHDRRRAALHLLDWMGCALAGTAEPVGANFLKNKTETPSGRAFAWGALGNILEMDDVDKRAILHCGPTIIPAALAAADNCSGKDLLDAIILGYEATIRLGRATGPGHYALWHSTATCGPIGAAASAASLLDLDRAGLNRAMSLAVSQATGFWQTRHEPDSAGKQLHAAHAARAGLDAAGLARHGLSGPLGILEGEQGFFAATCPDGEADNVLADYGEDWLIHQVSFKPWPACRHAHAAIDAALLAHDAGFRVEDVTGVEVVSYPDALKFCDRPDPQAVIEAKFSLQHSVAVVLLKGKPTLEDFAPKAIRDPDLASLRARIAVATGDPYATEYPRHYGAEVRVQTRDNERHVFTAPDALGDPENPLSEEGVRNKALGLFAAAGLEAEASAALVQSVLALADGGSVQSVLEVLP